MGASLRGGRKTHEANTRTHTHSLTLTNTHALIDAHTSHPQIKESAREKEREKVWENLKLSVSGSDRERQRNTGQRAKEQ